jgi:PAS domain S-box-containing protein
MMAALHILHLEDDPLDTELASAELRQAGLPADIRRVGTTQELTATLEAEPFDLILIDYRIPGVDALAAMGAARDVRPDLPIIFLSGTIPEDLAIEALKLGATDYVFKHQMHRLAPAVRRALEEANEQARRRQAEESLLRNKQRLEVALEAGALGAWEFDLCMLSTWRSSLFDRIFGYEPGSPEWTYDSFLAHVLSEDRPLIEHGFRRAVESCTQWRFQCRIRRSDGETRWIEGLGKVNCHADGRPDRAFGVVHDITERKRTEEALAHHKENLEKAVVERTAELREQAERLRFLAADLASAEQRERRRLAALLHDDLQQLLVAAKMHLHNAARRTDGAYSLQALEVATGFVDEATQAARDLTRQLRPPALYEDSLGAALRGLASEMAKRLRLNVKIEGSDTAKPANHDQKALLFEAVRELLLNVAKHAEDDEAVVWLLEEHGQLHVVVEDRGKGFDAAAGLPRSPSGFGLFSIRERIVAFGGALSIASSPGNGTRVTIRMPLLGQATEPQTLPSEMQIVSEKEWEETLRPEGVPSQTRILVVDDHAMVRQGLAMILNGDARLAVVAEASNGQEAIAAVERHRPDVVLMDVNMPHMNGIEATREIRRRWPEARIVGLSVQDDAGTVQAMRDAGASDFLAKTGDSDWMVSTIIGLGRNNC